MSATTVNINNLNVITFIKDIYQSLKHIDNSFHKMKTDIDTRMLNLEVNQKTILEKLDNLENLFGNIYNKINENNKIDKTLENELLDKMFILNQATVKNQKVDLKPRELTIANTIENGYSILDVSNTLEPSSLASTDANISLNYHEINDTMSIMEKIENYTQHAYSVSQLPQPKEEKNNLDSLLF